MHSAYSIQRDPRTFEFAAGMGMDGNHGNSTCTHQLLASQRNSIYSTISTLHFQLLPCPALEHQTPPTCSKFWHRLSTKWFFCSYSLPTGAPSTRSQSTQYVGRWWHRDSAVAAVNPCSVSVVSNLCSNSIVPAFPTYLCVCNVRGFRPYNRS